MKKAEGTKVDGGNDQMVNVTFQALFLRLHLQFLENGVPAETATIGGRRFVPIVLGARTGVFSVASRS